MKLLILGHKGMLGRAVTKHFSALPEYEVASTTVRFGEADFLKAIEGTTPDYIINCIGKIPQKKPASDTEFDAINIELPRALDALGIPVVHPSTDCEFKGDIGPGEAYSKTSKRDADDAYGRSKARISEELEHQGKNTKIIRTSIIGHEESTSVALLDWFLSQTGTVRGYTNHYWNGITTLEWAKQCQNIIEDWHSFPTLNQIGTQTHYSKYDILNLAKSVYTKDTIIEPFATDTTVNKCLVPDWEIPELETQLIELKTFFAN